MDIAQQKKNAKDFIKRWSTADRGREKQDSQSFWLDLLENVLGVEKPTEFIRFEKTVKLSHESFIDGYIDQTKVMIEQKGSSHDLSKAIKQSDGSLLTPFQQAQRYAGNLPYSERPRWIVTCNFVEFRVYDMEHPNSEPTIIKLEDLEKNYYQLEFLVDKSNQHLEKEKQVSLDAGELVGKIYNELLKQYLEPDSERSQRSINQLSVRLVFCLYAEDAGIFGKKNMFHDYLAEFSARDMRQALIKLFKVLDTKEEDRDPYLASDNPKLAQFPYVNGGMFSDEDIEIPPFTDKLRDLVLRNASDNFDWSEISPTIFGAVFESTLNPETRRQGGMHYTSNGNENTNGLRFRTFNDSEPFQQCKIDKWKWYNDDNKTSNFRLLVTRLHYTDEYMALYSPTSDDVHSDGLRRSIKPNKDNHRLIISESYNPSMLIFFRGSVIDNIKLMQQSTDDLHVCSNLKHFREQAKNIYVANYRYGRKR